MCCSWGYIQWWFSRQGSGCGQISRVWDWELSDFDIACWDQFYDFERGRGRVLSGGSEVGVCVAGEDDEVAEGGGGAGKVAGSGMRNRRCCRIWGLRGIELRLEF